MASTPHSLQANPVARPGTTVAGPNYRFTVLSECLIRYEWAEDGQFEDRPSTLALHRGAFEKPDFDVVDKGDSLEIITGHLHLTYDKKSFSAGGLTAEIKGRLTEWGSLWRYGTEDDSNLGGTARTLDNTNGRCPLGDGLIAKKGFAAVDDSGSMLFENSFVAPRRPGIRVDGYLFGYGHDYKGAIRDFYRLSGEQPTLPRWALGNWWSRYYPYSHDSYLGLMDAFRERSVPISVAVIDMDWHLIDEAPHAGWTGYTWNKKLFPDPENFAKELHNRGIKMTLNDHPHAGVHHHEDAYEEMAAVLNHDTSKKHPIAFDAASPEYLKAYFGVALRKLEDAGCDFWWVDWQQGPYSKVESLDPLVVLNHFHFLHSSAITGGKPILFSRYAGLGSHRYPLGFSGDVVTTWESLKFQPEFTATASNVGYGWWSHDIGGHFFGVRQSELYARWVQLGTFSPILRLHSSISRWNSREPWLYKDGAIIEKFLALRHRLIPYLYTSMVLSTACKETLVQPMYWEYPDREEAYKVPNEYIFGNQLIVAPVVQPNNLQTGLGRAEVWLPPGRFVDFFTGTVYDGDRKLDMWRPLGALPVFARTGSIIPLDASSAPANDCRNPDAFEVVVVIGSDAKYEILEDYSPERGSDDAAPVVAGSSFGFTYDQKSGKLVAKLSGRRWTFRFLGVAELPRDMKVTINGEATTSAEISATEFQHTRCLTVDCPDTIDKPSEIVIELGEDPQPSLLDHASRIDTMLMDYEGELDTKDAIWDIVKSDGPLNVKVGSILSLGLDSALTGPVLELLLSDSRANK